MLRECLPSSPDGKAHILNRLQKLEPQVQRSSQEEGFMDSQVADLPRSRLKLGDDHHADTNVVIHDV